jgi:mono/diheme cytochrome c family protein
MLELPMLKPLLIATGLLLSSAAWAQDPALRGRALLDEHCSRCHAIDKAGDSPREGAPAFRTLSRSFNMDEFAGKLQGGLMSGHPDMPEFRFNEDDARAVAAYLRSIQE